jgi:hypothetical protein
MSEQRSGRQVISDISELKVKPSGSSALVKVADHLSGWVNVRSYGAKGDGVWNGSAWVGTDDRADIQAAIESVRPTFSQTDSAGFKNANPARIVIPNRAHALGAPLVLYSGQEIIGSGPGSKLVALPGFVGSAMVVAGVARPGLDSVIQQAAIRGLSFEAEQPDVWAVDLTTGSYAPAVGAFQILQVTIEGLRLWTKQGIKLGDLPSVRPVFSNVANGASVNVSATFTNGTTVKVAADGVFYPDQVVTGGTIISPTEAHALSVYVLGTGSYTQGCTIRDVISFGAIDHLLVLSGNENLIENLDKEGASAGAGTDPYVWVRNTVEGGRASANRFSGLLVEATASALKNAVLLDGTASTLFDRLWVETSASAGYTLDARDSLNVVIGEVNNIRSAVDFSGRKLRFREGSFGRLGYTREPHQWGRVKDAVEVDATSHFEIDAVGSWYGRAITRANDMATTRYRAETALSLVQTPKAGIAATNRPTSTIGSLNLFTNGSFEAGRYGWSINAAITAAQVDSEIVPGTKALRLTTWPGSETITQDVSISAAHVGLPVSIAIWGKLSGGVSGNSGTKLMAWASGCGITTDIDHRYAQNDDGWVLLTKTVVPQSAGPLTIGAYLRGPDGTATVDLDAATATIGLDNHIQAGRFGSINVGGREWTYAAAAPTTGTWAAGSVVWNSAPTAGGAAGWVCTVAGTPGTWKVMAATDIARASAQADSAAIDVAALKTDFNALLAKLRAAGLLAP